MLKKDELKYLLTKLLAGVPVRIPNRIKKTEFKYAVLCWESTQEEGSAREWRNQPSAKNV